MDERRKVESLAHDSISTPNTRRRGFLPSDVVAIALCETDSLICLSTRAETFGQVFYWYYYWQYPWVEAHFEAVLASVVGRYSDIDRITSDPDHPAHQEASDALNYATLTFVAPSFDEFLAGLRDEDALG